MNKPLFSIILPTKNNTRTIKKCLESILNQTYLNIEVIFVDNFSDDDTLKIAKSFENKMNIKIFQIWPERHIQRRFWFEKSTWDIVYFIDSDMYICSENFIQESVDIFINNPNIWWLIVPEDNFEWKGYWTKVKALERSFYDWDNSIEAARIFRRNVYEEVGWYNEKLIAWEDWDLSERIKKAWNIIKRTSSRVLHDEWEIELIKLLKKKMYYGWQIWWYIKTNNKSSIISKIYIFRLVYYKKFYKFLQKPILFPGFIAMMTLELISAWIWLIKSKIN